MSSRTVLVIATVIALILVAATLLIGWQQDGRINAVPLLFVPILLIGLAAAFRKKR